MKLNINKLLRMGLLATFAAVSVLAGNAKAAVGQTEIYTWTGGATGNTASNTGWSPEYSDGSGFSLDTAGHGFGMNVGSNTNIASFISSAAITRSGGMNLSGLFVQGTEETPVTVTWYGNSTSRSMDFYGTTGTASDQYTVGNAQITVSDYATLNVGRSATYNRVQVLAELNISVAATGVVNFYLTDFQAAGNNVNISGGGAVNIFKAATAGTNTSVGTWNISGGSTLDFSNNASSAASILVLGSTSNLALNNANIKFSAHDYALSNAVALGAGGATISGAANTTLSGVISGAGALTISSTTNTTLSGDNTYEGGTNLTGGTLQAASNTAFGTGSVTVNAGAIETAEGVVIGNNISLATSTYASAGENLNVTAVNGAANITGDSLAFGSDTIENATISNAYVVGNTGSEIKSSTMTNGTLILAAATGTVTLTNVTFNSGTGIENGAFNVNSLTATGTVVLGEVSFTALSFDVEGITTVGNTTIFTTTDTLTIGGLANTSTGITGGAAGYNYVWNVVGDSLVITITQDPAPVTDLTVTGVSYADGTWNFTMSDAAYQAFTDADYAGDLVFADADVMGIFETLRRTATSNWLEDLVIANASGDSLNITDEFGKFTIMGTEYDAANGGYFLAYIPEPSTVTMSLLALAGLAARRRRKA